MAKKTENVVLFLKSDKKTQIFADKVSMDGTPLPNPCPKGHKKKMILVDTMVYSADRKVYEDKDVYAPDLRTVDGIAQFLEGFNNLPCQPRSGYDSFVNAEGATNPKSPKKFTADGTFRILLCYLEALHLKVAEGGQKGEDAAALIAMIPQYNAVAMEKAMALLETQKKQVVATKAAALDIDPDELAAFLADRAAKRAAAAGTIPAATVTKADADADEDETEETGEAEDTIEVDADDESGEPTADIEETESVA